MAQWQGYTKNDSSAAGYDHFYGYFREGNEAAPPLENSSYTECRSRCDALATCLGFCFESLEREPAHVKACYVKASLAPNHMDLSMAGHCTGEASPSDCPFHIYRTSGDIYHTWGSMLANLQSTIPFLGGCGAPGSASNCRLPYPQGDLARSRPGG